MADYRLPNDLVQQIKALRDRDATTGRALYSLQAAPPQARVSKAAMSCANNAFTTVTFDTELYDSATIHSTSLNTSRLTAPADGLYTIGTYIVIPSGTGTRAVNISHSVAGTIAADERAAVSGGPTIITFTTEYHLTAGQYAEVAVFQNSGGALNVAAGFWTHRVGPQG